jgi:FtsH-binding integral membrane protein
MSINGITADTVADQQRAYLQKVFAWMFVGLALTGGIAYWFSSSGDMLRYFNDHPGVLWGAFIAEIGLVLGISWGINRISAAVATFLFCLYAGLSGVVFSAIIEVYTPSSVYQAFFITSGTFGAMAIYGYTTKRDLSKYGSLLFMALIGLIIAIVVNVIWPSSTLFLIISIVGVLLFTALTAYDVNKIKQQGAMGLEGEAREKGAILGALRLYLDFVNLFLFILQLFGSSRS